MRAFIFLTSIFLFIACYNQEKNRNENGYVEYDENGELLREVKRDSTKIQIFQKLNDGTNTWETSYPISPLNDFIHGIYREVYRNKPYETMEFAAYSDSILLFECIQVSHKEGQDGHSAKYSIKGIPFILTAVEANDSFIYQTVVDISPTFSDSLIISVYHEKHETNEREYSIKDHFTKNGGVIAKIKNIENSIPFIEAKLYLHACDTPSIFIQKVNEN